MEEKRVDLRITDLAGMEEGKRLAQLIFKLNHTIPMTEEYTGVLKSFLENVLARGALLLSRFKWSVRI